MAIFGKVEVIDKGGWRKEFQLSKSLIYIGSDPSCDVVLGGERGVGVAARHLQLLALPGGGSGGGMIRIINLGAADIPIDPRSAGVQSQVLHRWSAVVIGDGARFRLGDFYLSFHFGEVVVEARAREGAGGTATVASGVAVAGAVAAVEVGAAAPEAAATSISSANIGLELRLPDETLEVGHPLEGAILVRNQGDRPAVQVNLALEGLDQSCYEMGPGPILFPNAEKEVLLRVFNPGKPRPTAGEHRIRISATAAQAYPGQKAEASQVLRFAPFYAHEVSFPEKAPGAGRQTLTVVVFNAGNVRSRYQLRAEEPDSVLGLDWMLEGASLSAPRGRQAAAEAASVAASGRAAAAKLEAGLGKPAEKVRKVGRLANTIAGMLATAGSMLPPSIGGPLTRAASSLRRTQMDVTRVAGAPSRAVRSVRSFTPMSTSLARQAQAGPAGTLVRRAGRLQSLFSRRGQAPEADNKPRARARPAAPVALVAGPAGGQTPFVGPGERLTLELRYEAVGRHERRQHTISVSATSLEQEVAQPGAPAVVAEKAVEITGVSWPIRLLPFVIGLLALLILLILAYRFIYLH